MRKKRKIDNCMEGNGQKVHGGGGRPENLEMLWLENT